MQNDLGSASKDDERIDVRGDGRIILYKRSGLKNPKWQARIRIPNATGYKIVSTKTAKLSAAEHFAQSLYEDLYHHVKSGGSLNTKTFAQVFGEWEASIAIMGATTKGGSWDGTIDRVRKYALGYFGTMKIDEIGSANFQQFYLWRKENYSKRQPTNGTLLRERTSIMAVFKFAVEMDYIKALPKVTRPKSANKRRPTFTQQEWEVILKKIDKWVSAGEQKATKRDRFVARYYFLVLVNTGLRIGELRNLRWGDTRPVRTKDANYVIADVKGKTGSREVVFLKGTGRLLNKLINHRCEELEAMYPDDSKKWKPTRSELIFCHPDGTEISSFKRSFHSLLDFAGIPIERNGTPRTIYSLRHLYATQRLYEDVPVYHLAKQMGTSVEMIEKHYGQTITSQAAAQITQTRKIPTESENHTVEYFND